MNAKSETAAADLQALMAEIEVLKAAVEELRSKAPRDRGPKSLRAMTEDDAKRVKFGDLAKSSHKEAATALGLSYGQIYSCRNGYTFNQVKP